MAINRITGTNSGIDVDSVVKQSLSGDQNKIDKAYQQQKVYEYQQSQLQEIVSDAAGFYDKYLDRLSSGNMLSDKFYQIGTFKATDQAGNTTAKVSAKAYAGADISDYKISLSQVAKKASTIIKSDSAELQSVIALGDPKGVISVRMKDSRENQIYAAADIVITDGEIDMNKTVTALNSALKKKGINVSAKYSEFSQGIVLESGMTGESVSFGVAVKAGETTSDEHLSLDSLTYTHYSGQNAKGTVTKETDIGEQYTLPIDEESNTFIADNIEFSFKGISNQTPITNPVDIDSIHDLNEDSNNVTIKQESVDKCSTITTKNNSSGNPEKKTICKTYSSGVTVKVYTNYDSAGNPLTPITTVSGNLKDLTSSDGTSVVSGGTTTITKGDFDHGNGMRTEKVGNTITTTLKENNGAITIRTVTHINSDGSKDIDTDITGSIDESILGNNYKTTITSSDGKKQTCIAHGVNSNNDPILIRTTTESCSDGSSKEKITQTNATDVLFADPSATIKATKSEAINLSGETDVSKLKDDIVKFVDEYNKLVEKINTKIWEKREKDYMPLTEEQKKGMTDTQIEAWEEKAKEGLLRSDSDLRRIQSQMKSAMSSLMSGTGLSLEQIGIKPVDNYTKKNGMYTIDEDKLTSALENNSAEVKDLFTRKASDDEQDKGGVLVQLAKVLKDEVKSSKSSLAGRIGFEGTSTESNNTLSNYISKQKKLIKELKSRYTSKETSLYNKYSNLETMLEKLNAQTSSLYTMLGLNG